MKPYSGWKIEYLDWKSNFIRTAITAAIRLPQINMKNLLLKVIAKRAVRKQWQLHESADLYSEYQGSGTHVESLRDH